MTTRVEEDHFNVRELFVQHVQERHVFEGTGEGHVVSEFTESPRNHFLRRGVFERLGNRYQVVIFRGTSCHFFVPFVAASLVVFPSASLVFIYAL